MRTRIVFFLCVAAIMALGTMASAATILITGTNRGIGLELSKQYGALGWDVIATARTPDRADDLQAIARNYSNVVIERLDVTDDEEIAVLADKYRGKPIDILLNNAGMLGDVTEQSFGTLNFDTIKHVIDVNTYGPIKLAQAFRDNIAASEQKKILNMTSGLGSMTLTSRRGGFYAYRMSKAALNMATRILRADLQGEGLVVSLISPGMVQTQLLADSGYRGPAITTEESVTGLIKIIEGITLDNAGTPVNYDGQVLPW